MGLVQTTLVPCLDDERVPALLLKVGQPLFCFDGERVVPGFVKSVSTPMSCKYLRVLLDSGESFRVTSNQELMCFDRSVIRASEVSVGTSLLPLYLKKDDHGYTTYQQLRADREQSPELTDRRTFRKVSRMVGSWKLGLRQLEARTYCQHIDGDIRNCHPDNIEVTETPADQVVYRQNKSKWAKDIKDAQALLERHRSMAKPYRIRLPEIGPEAPDVKNHAVMGVHESDGYDDFVVIETEGNLPFAIGGVDGGVFVMPGVVGA